MSHSCKRARALSFACSPKVYQSVSKRWRIDFMFYQLILIKGQLFIEDFFGTEKGHSSIDNQSCSRSLCRVSDKTFPPGLEDSLKEEYRGEVSWRCGGSGPVQNWFWWGSVRHDRVTHGRWEESPGNLYLRRLKVSHENVNNTGLQGQPRSAVRSLCLIFAAGISASHEMSQSQSYVFNPLESSPKVVWWTHSTTFSCHHSFRPKDFLNTFSSSIGGFWCLVPVLLETRLLWH